MANKPTSREDGISPLSRDTEAVGTFLAYLESKCDILREQVSTGSYNLVFSMDVKVATQVAHLAGQLEAIESLISDINKTLRVS